MIPLALENHPWEAQLVNITDLVVVLCVCFYLSPMEIGEFSENFLTFFYPTFSPVSSLSGSVELNESKTVSVDFEKTNSISSDEGSYNLHLKVFTAGVSANRKLRQTSSNSLTVQSYSNHLNQSMPNLTSGPYHTHSNNTLLVPGAQKSQSAHSSHSGNLLSPSHRGTSYPPPSPTR